MSGLVTAAGAACAVWLLMPPGPSGPLTGHRGRARGLRAARTLAGAAVVAVVAGALFVMLDGTVLVLGLLGVAAAAGGWQMTARTRGRKAAQRRADDVVEVCEALASELKAGQPPLAALRHCVEVWPELEPVAAAGALGADVPKAMRRLALLPGASGLDDVAAAWQVAHGSGGTMALALGRVAEASRRRRSTRHLVASELASALATARLVAALPVVVLAMGSGIGGDPWGFLLGTPVGLGCLAAGLLLAYAGLAWIEKIAVSAADS